MTHLEPWSKRHKQLTQGSAHSLSNSFAQPLNSAELIAMAIERGDEELVRAFHGHSLAYTPMGGSLDLREEIARGYGPKIQARNIVVFAGAQVALQTAAMALLDESSHSIVFTPGYQSVQAAPSQAGSRVTTIPLLPENGWKMDLGAVRDAIEAQTRYIVINEPHNPTGSLMSAETQAGLIEIAEANDLWLLSDEVYRLLEHEPEDRLPAMADLYSKGLSACTLSKPWGGCGITIGWLALQDMSLKQKLIDTQYFGSACPSRASELQAIMTLRASERILARNMTIIKHNMALLDTFMEKYGGLFEWVRPRAGAVAFLKFNGPLSSEELGAELAEAGISVKPAYVFTGCGGRYADYFRVGYGEEIMPEALQALTEFVEEHLVEWRRAARA